MHFKVKRIHPLTARRKEISKAVKIGFVGTLDGPDSYEILELGNNTTQAEDPTFLKARQSGDPSAIRCDYSKAVKTLQLTLATTQSAIEGRSTSL